MGENLREKVIQVSENRNCDKAHGRPGSRIWPSLEGQGPFPWGHEDKAGQKLIMWSGTVFHADVERPWGKREEGTGGNLKKKKWERKKRPGEGWGWVRRRRRVRCDRAGEAGRLRKRCGPLKGEKQTCFFLPLSSLVIGESLKHLSREREAVLTWSDVLFWPLCGEWIREDRRGDEDTPARRLCCCPGRKWRQLGLASGGRNGACRSEINLGIPGIKLNGFSYYKTPQRRFSRWQHE